MDGIAGFGARRSLVVGAGIGAGNPKNMAVALARAVAISSSGLGAPGRPWCSPCTWSSPALGVATPVVAVLVLGDRSSEVLEGWRSWLVRNNSAMLAVIYLLLGVLLIGRNLGAI